MYMQNESRIYYMVVLQLKVSRVDLSLQICWLSGLNNITYRFKRSKPYSSTYFGDGDGCRFLLLDVCHLLPFVVVRRLSLFFVCHLLLFVVWGLLLFVIIIIIVYYLITIII